MNTEKYLLTQLNEECAEVIQESSKAIRFGLDDVYEKEPELGSNAQRIQKEIHDVLAIIELMEERGVFTLKINRGLLNSKKEKVKHYMDYAISRGELKKL